MNDVIVIGSNYTTALGIARAVGMAGYGVRFLSLSHECAKLIGTSRYVVRTIESRADFKSICDSMEILRNEEDVIPVIPTDDKSTLLLDENADLLNEHYCFPNIDHTQGEIAKWMNKVRQKELAKRCNLAVAEGKAYAADSKGLTEALSEATYPCVTKAISSIDCDHSKEIFKVCSNEQDLKEMINEACDRHCSSVLVEQLIDVEKEYAVYGLAYNGKIVLPACVDTWRSGHGAHNGVTAEGRMINADFLGEDKERLKEMVRTIGLNGLFCIDLIYSNGRYYFIELNLRYGSSGFAATVGGANLPGIYAGIMLNGGELDESVSMHFEPHFLNEKVDLDDYRVGYLSWKEYKANQRGDKVRFIQNSDDPMPWMQFRIMEFKKHLARTIWGTKRRA